MRYLNVSCSSSILILCSLKVQLNKWHTDPNAEIFMDRNGVRFQYVLDYKDERIILLQKCTSCTRRDETQRRFYRTASLYSRLFVSRMRPHSISRIEKYLENRSKTVMKS